MGEMLTFLARRGSRWLERSASLSGPIGSPSPARSGDARRFELLARALLSRRCEASGTVITREAMALSDRVARFKQPRRIVFIEAPPENLIGSFQRTVPRDRHNQIFREVIRR